MTTRDRVGSGGITAGFETIEDVQENVVRSVDGKLRMSFAGDNYHRLLYERHCSIQRQCWESLPTVQG